MNEVVRNSGALALVVEAPKREASFWRRFKLNGDEVYRQILFDEYRDYALMLSNVEFKRRPAYGLEKIDFDQHAYTGLLQALDRYDPTSSCSFKTFARYRIIGSIADGIVRSSERATAFSMTRVIETERLKSLMRDNPISESSYPLDILRDLVANLAVGILVESVSQEHESSIEDIEASNGFESLHFNQVRRTLLKEIESLPLREKGVVKRHYLEDMAFKLIAKLMGLTKGRISQLHRSAIERLREKLKRI